CSVWDSSLNTRLF
nr:immunoglobulin light chain junction region [Macaca mulatta]MPO03664.1 immunoglobulin light chain junction region [Macaca mulatta]MPO05690.1 immunoglobulin light chain junction region [Macaca mulatta]MPO07080.1 immunoglobulin light chain junction region [Macaca mulatta]MPO07432.1 immunoglobulin light chain junction region [Macaca mulatta]